MLVRKIHGVFRKLAASTTATLDQVGIVASCTSFSNNCWRMSELEHTAGLPDQV